MNSPDRTRLFIVVASFLTAGALMSAQALITQAAPATAPAVDPPKTGAMHVQFSEPSPSSSVAACCTRLGWQEDQMRKGGFAADYDLAAESFEVYVPADYDGSKPFGLLVWVSPGQTGGIPIESWREKLDQRHLIWIGANQSGNPRPVTCRAGLAIDAAFNLKSRYKLDDQRIYVAGASGGGRVSSMLGIAFPDVFCGGCYMIGCDFYRNLPADEPHKYWARSFLPPPAKFLSLAKTQSRHVLLTGETDPNRPQTKGNLAAMKSDGFKHLTYFEVPGMGHRPPDADWFDKALAALDEIPKSAPAAKLATLPAEAPAAQDVPVEADKQLRAARLYLDHELYPQARERLRRLIAAYPRTPAAEEAKKLLAKIPPE
jgi:pimeloyl-ACP methyl ester carboxylesterase